MKRGKAKKLILAIFLAFIITIVLLPVAAMSASGTVNVRIIGENSTILNVSVNVDDVIDYTTDAADSSTGINALDAVIYATLQNGHDASSYTISYSSGYGTYYINEIAAITPSGFDYFGTLTESSSGGFDSGALSAHALTAGDTYIVYYDKYTGGSANYGYQSYAWFTADSASGTTGSIVPVEVRATTYDDSYNTIAANLSNTTIYATGVIYSSTPVAVTDSDGKAYITFGDAGTYTLNLSSDYTYAECVVTVAGNSVTLSDVDITVTDGTDNLAGASLTLTDGSNHTYSPYQISSGTFKYRLAAGTYNYYASANGYQPASGTIVVSGTETQSLTLTAMNGYAVTITPGNTANESVIVKDNNGSEKTPISTIGGIYTYDLVNGTYTYTVNRSGYHSSFGSFTVNSTDKSILTDTLTDVASGSADWSAFRDFNDNMATVSYPTAEGSWQTEEDWATSLGALGSYRTLSSSNIVLYDGYLYVATEHGLSKVAKNTGELLTTTALATDESYAPQIAYGDGKIFVTNATGIDAFDALSMALVWSTPISAFGDYVATTPILYDNTSKTLYVGDYGDSNYTLGTYGGYSAIDAETGASNWIMYGGETDARYWAGAVIVGDYVVFGSDSGTLTSVKTDASGFATASGTLTVNGKIRSSIAYDGTYLYFTTDSGYIYKVSINNSTGEFTSVASRKFTTGSNSTPVVYNGRIYVGANDGIYVLNSSDLSQVSNYITSGSVQSSGFLTTAYGDKAYVYFTVNSARGEIIVISDDGTNISYETLYTPSKAQYTFTSLIADSDGTIYYTNDSGYIFAIRNTNETKTDKAKTTINVSPASAYDSGTYTTIYPTITVKDNAGNEISTSSAGTYYLFAGSYSYKVSLSGYNISTGSFDISADDVTNGCKTVPVTLSSSSGPAPFNLTITVSVIGDDNDTWINDYTVTVSNEASAWDAIKKALDSNHLTYVTSSSAVGVYVSKVKGLAEFDNGINSGWKYSVNGISPNVGISSYMLSDGDEVILYYTDDYTEDSTSGSISDGASSITAEANVTATLNKNTGVANATLSGNNLKDFNKSVSESSDAQGSVAQISVDIPKGASGAALTIPQSTVSTLGDTSNTSLKIETSCANLTLDPETVAAVCGAAGNGNITINISQVENSGLSDENKEIVGRHPVYDLSILADGKKITDFGNGKVKVSIPYTPLNGENTPNLTIYYINSEGKATEMSGAYYDASTGCVIFVTEHFSIFAIVYDDTVRFTDVSENNWYYEAVKYVSQNNIMNGTSDTIFNPSTDMTRAMLVTVLYRLEGKPNVSGTNSFTDVKDGQWYTSAIIWASENSIVSGYGGGLFGTNDSITREQMAALLYNYARYKGYNLTATSDLTAYSDTSSISNWAQTAMKWANYKGLINGVSSNKLVPAGEATRAQVATILMRFVENNSKLNGTFRCNFLLRYFNNFLK